MLTCGILSRRFQPHSQVDGLIRNDCHLAAEPSHFLVQPESLVGTHFFPLASTWNGRRCGSLYTFLSFPNPAIPCSLWPTIPPLKVEDLQKSYLELPYPSQQLALGPRSFQACRMPDQDCFPFAAQGSYNSGQGIRLGNFDRLAPPSSPNQSARPALRIKTEGSQLRFACPYHKRSPNEEPKQRSCVYPGFRSIARLKEHLYRHHMQLRCSRCKEAFKNDAALKEHYSARLPCTLRKCQPDYGNGLDQDQKARLKKRERTSDKNTDEDKWKAIYQTLFPGEVAISTPYCNDAPSTELDDYHQYCRENSDRVLGGKLGADPSGVWSGSAQQMKELMRDVQEQLFWEFHAQQNDDDRSSRASTPMSASPRTPLYFEENPPMPTADSEAHISKKRRMDDTDLRQRQFDETMGGEACLSNNHVLYQASPPPQIRVSPAEPQSCEAFIEGYSIAQLNLDGNLSLPAQSVHDAVCVPAPALDPTSTFTLDSEISDEMISDSPGPWEADWTLFEP